MPPRKNSFSKPNSYFQSAVKNPARKMTSKDERPYKHAGASKQGVVEVAGTYSVTVGTQNTSQRTWVLPKALLARHSDLFAFLMRECPDREGTELPAVSPVDFANFVDYIHSSIYSLNTQVAGYRATRANTDACLLGVRLEAKSYSDAALIQLRNLFRPVAHYGKSNAKLSLMKASDIDYVCTQTSSTSVTPTTKSYSAAALKQLFFDALVSHWATGDILSIGSHEDPIDTTTWSHVYRENHDFRIWIVKSTQTPDSKRHKFLRPYTVYLDPPASWVDPRPEYDMFKQEDGTEALIRKLLRGVNTGVQTKKEDDGDGEVKVKTGDGEVRTPRLKLTLKIPKKRRSNGDPGRDTTSGSSAEDLNRMRQESGAGAASEEAVEEEDGMDIDLDAGIEDEELD